MGRKYSSYCCVLTCVNSSNKKDLVFFSLPTDKARRMEWLRLIWREDLADLSPCYRYHSVCQDHFAEDCMIKTSKRLLLKPDSVPTLYLPQLNQKNAGNARQSRNTKLSQTIPTSTNPKSNVQIMSTSSTQTIGIDRVQVDVSTPTTSTHKEPYISPETSRKRKLGQYVTLSNKLVKASDSGFDFDIICERDKLITLCEKMSEELLPLLKAEQKITMHGSQKEYHDNLKFFCLYLYYASPVVYNLLQNALSLPDVNTIYEGMSINTHFLKALKAKVESMSVLEKHCLLVIDSMPLTVNFSYDDKEDAIIGFHEVNGFQSPTPAVKALVVMVQGIFHSWKQPVAYALLSEGTFDVELAQWIHQLINKLCDIGLNIRILNFASEAESEVFEKKWVSPNAPYFFISGRKIYYINDPKMLLKLLRDCFLFHDMRFCDRVAKYEHIVQFYEKDVSCSLDESSRVFVTNKIEIMNDYRLAPKLTKSHIYPTGVEKANLRYVVELLSPTVASGLSAYIDIGEIEPAARATVEFITTVSQLFECLNSLNDPSDKKLIYGDKGQVTYLKEMLIFIQNLKLLKNNTGKNVTNKSGKFLQSIQITIRSFISLADELKLEKCHLMKTGTLNKGVTEEFFKQIRTISNATEPTIEQFVKAFRKILYLKAAEPSKDPNQRRDVTKFLIHMKREIFADEPYGDNATEKSHGILPDTGTILNRLDPKGEDIPIPLSDYNHIDKPEKHTLIYVCGYLLKKCRDNHKKCEMLKKYIEGIGDNVSVNNVSRYMQYSQRNQLCLIAIPCDHFVQIVERMEEKFRKTFKLRFINCKIEQTLFKELIFDVIACKPCYCFPSAYLVKLFIRLRVAYTTQLNTREFRRNQTQFVIPLLLPV